MHSDDYFTCRATVIIDGEEWPKIELEMIPPHRADMLAFFEEIGVQATCGLPTIDEWESEFAQLRLTAHGDAGGVIQLEVLARWKPTYETSRTGELEVTAEAMERFYERLRAVLKLPHGHRFSSTKRRQRRST